MPEINLNLTNKEIINKYFNEITCDEYQESIFKGGQSNADQALNNLDIHGYSKKKKQCISDRKKEDLHIYLHIYDMDF